MYATLKITIYCVYELVEEGGGVELGGRLRRWSGGGWRSGVGRKTEEVEVEEGGGVELGGRLRRWKWRRVEEWSWEGD